MKIPEVNLRLVLMVLFERSQSDGIDRRRDIDAFFLFPTPLDHRLECHELIQNM